MGVQTEVVAEVLHLTPVSIGRKWGELLEHVVSNFLHEPVKAFTLHVGFQRQLLSDVSHVHKSGEWLAGVEVLLVCRVEPGLNNTSEKERKKEREMLYLALNSFISIGRFVLGKIDTKIWNILCYSFPFLKVLFYVRISKFTALAFVSKHVKRIRLESG